MFLIVSSLLVAGALCAWLLPEVGDRNVARSARRRLSRLARHVRHSLEPAPAQPAPAGSQNAMVRAAECFASGRYEEARVLYELCARGVHAENPQLLLGLARSQVALADPAAALKTLDRLKDLGPGAEMAEAEQLRAQSLEKLGAVNGAATKRAAA